MVDVRALSADRCISYGPIQNIPVADESPIVIANETVTVTSFTVCNYHNTEGGRVFVKPFSTISCQLTAIVTTATYRFEVQFADEDAEDWYSASILDVSSGSGAIIPTNVYFSITNSAPNVSVRISNMGGYWARFRHYKVAGGTSVSVTVRINRGWGKSVSGVQV